MAKFTKIEWCDSTVNPVMGCEGCELWSATVKACYAGVLHRRFGGTSPGYAPSFEQATRFPGRMTEAAEWTDLQFVPRNDKPWLDNLPRVIFISDMGDALSTGIDFDYLRQEIVSNVCSPQGERHIWLWLTKRPRRMAAFSEYLDKSEMTWPTNLWAGTTITTKASVSRITDLREVGNSETGRFLSVEPQLEELSLKGQLDGISWVIHGGESGVNARPFDLTWVRDLMDTCRKAEVPYFLKQLGSDPRVVGKRFKLRCQHGNNWDEWPIGLHVREVPFRKEPDLFDKLEMTEESIV